MVKLKLAQPYLLGILHTHEARSVHRGLDKDAVHLMIGEAPTDDELSDGRSVLLDYDGREGKRVGFRANRGKDHDGCDEWNTGGSISQSFGNKKTGGWKGLRYHRSRLLSWSYAPRIPKDAGENSG